MHGSAQEQTPRATADVSYDSWSLTVKYVHDQSSLVFAECFLPEAKKEAVEILNTALSLQMIF